MATRTWNGGGANDNWTTALNWDVVPVAGDDLVFAGATRTSPSNDFAADTSFASITFAAAASAFTLVAGNRITLTGNITNSSSNTQTINIPVILNVATCTVDGSSNMVLGGIVSQTGGTRALTKTGTGTTTMSAANSYAGTTTISAGTLAYQSTYASTSHVIASGAIFVLNTTGTVSYATTTFSGAGTFRKTGTGLCYWGATAATFALASGSLIDVVAGAINGGNSGNEVWTSNLSDLTVASGATFSGTEANIRVNRINGAGTIVSGFSGAGYTAFTMGVDNGTGGVFSGALTNTDASPHIGNYVKAGTGTQTLSGTNTYTGTTTITGGTLQIGNAGTTGALSTSSTITVTSPGTLQFNRSNAVASGVDFKQVIGGTGALTQAGSGSLTLGGINTYTGATTVSAGLLVVTGSLASGSAVTVQTGGTLGGTGTINGSLTVNSGGTVGPGLSGVSIGTLTTAATTLSAGSTMSVDLASAGPTADKIASTTTISLAGALTIADQNTPAAGKTYTILTATTSITGTFTGKANGSVFATPGSRYRITYNANSVVLTSLPRSSQGFAPLFAKVPH